MTKVIIEFGGNLYYYKSGGTRYGLFHLAGRAGGVTVFSATDVKSELGGSDPAL
jgi:hypothetical protein